MEHKESIEAWRKVLGIFSKYVDEEQASFLHSAEHDQIWAGPNPADVSGVDQEKLEEYGWHPSYENECFYKFV